MIRVHTSPKTKLGEIAAWYRSQGFIWQGSHGADVYAIHSDEHGCLVWEATFEDNQVELAAYFKVVFG